MTVCECRVSGVDACPRVSQDGKRQILWDVLPFVMHSGLSSMHQVASCPSPLRRRFPWPPAAVLPLAVLAVLASGAPGHSQALYKLETKCSLGGAAAVPCTVEAIDEGDATLYRHTIGSVVETVRITDKPVTMSRWDEASRSWKQMRQAEARFSTNTVCFDQRRLCVVNPNYLNSVREDRAGSNLDGRDLVMVHFGTDGRVDASCYDDACALILK